MGIVDTVHADLVVRGRDGRAVLVVEVKGSARFPEVYKRALGLVVDAFRAPYAMLAMPDKVLLFRIGPGGGLSDTSKPIATLETRRLVERYFPEASEKGPTGGILESVVDDWLRDLAKEPEGDIPGKDEIAAAGLLEQISGAETVREASARLRW